MTTPDDVPVCTLGAAESRDREGAWRTVISGALRSKVATASGVKLEFDSDSGVAHTIVDLIAAERACCGWATWTLTGTAASTVVEIGADGPGGDVLRAMFDVPA